MVTARIENRRMAVVPVEPHAIAVDPTAEPLTVWFSGQAAHAIRDGLAASLGLPADQVRSGCPRWAGGSARRACGSPSTWPSLERRSSPDGPCGGDEQRSENLLSMHGRAQVQYVRVGATTEGELTSLEAFVISDAGAYVVAGGFLPTATRLMAQGCYRIPAVAFDHAVVCTNTSPLLAFRGAGRPQATALVERMVDQVARRLDLDPLEVRARNFIQPDEFPFTTATGAVYDSGDYEGAPPEGGRARRLPAAPDRAGGTPGPR